MLGCEPNHRGPAARPYEKSTRVRIRGFTDDGAGLVIGER